MKLLPKKVGSIDTNDTYRIGDGKEAGGSITLQLVPDDDFDGVLTIMGRVRNCPDADFVAIPYEGLQVNEANGIFVDGNVQISATAEKFKTTRVALYRIGGVYYTKAATDNLVFSAAYTINTAQAAGQFWGAFLVQIDAADTITTKAVAADQVFVSQAAALAAVPAPDAGNIELAVISVQSKVNVKWTATTDDMTAASDAAASTFTDADTLSADDTTSTQITTDSLIRIDATGLEVAVLCEGLTVGACAVFLERTTNQ